MTAMSPTNVRNWLILKKNQWEHKRKRKKVGSNFKEQMQDILLQTFSTTRPCQISAAPDYDSSTKEQLYICLSSSPFLSNIASKKSLFVGKNFLTLCF